MNVIMKDVVRNKSKIWIFAIGILSFFLVIGLLTASCVVLIRKAESNVRETLVNDNRTVVGNIVHLYMFDLDCLNYSLGEIRKDPPATARELKTRLRAYYDFFNRQHNSVIADLRAVYAGEYLSMCSQDGLTGDYREQEWYRAALEAGGQTAETGVYDHPSLGRKVFSYAVCDESLGLVISLDIDCEKIIEYHIASSVEHCFLSLINGEGEVLASEFGALVGADTHDLTGGRLYGFADHMEEIRSQPDTFLYNFGEKNTFSVAYYLEEADRYIITIYYPSDTLKEYGILLPILSGAVILVFGVCVFILLRRTIARNRAMIERVKEAEHEKKETARLYDILTSVVEYRSSESGSHTRRVQEYTRIIAREVAKRCPELGLDEDKVENIALASSLHDIGKIAVPDNILNKPGKLTPEEFEIMKTHTTRGAEMIDGISDGKEDYFVFARNIALGHHERYDGGGYPAGLKGEAIPIEAQIVSVVDVLDALVNKRCYKDAIGFDEAVRMILDGKCGAFNPKLMEILVSFGDELRAVRDAHADE